MTSPGFPVGAYVGLPSTNPSTEPEFEAAVAGITSLLGAAPAYMNTGIDQSQPVSSWLSNGQWDAQSWAASPATVGAIPNIGLPLASSAPGSASADQMFQAFASGVYDQMLYALVQSWAAAGATTQVWRPGWEMDLSDQPWYVTTNPATQADYVAAFQHIYTVLHAAAAQYGVTVEVAWTPAIANATGVVMSTYYPGNAYVDIVAADAYSGQFPYSLYDWGLNNGTVDSSYAQWAANPVNRIHYWNYPADNGYVLDGSNGTSISLSNLLAFAQANNKPFAISEAGAGGGAPTNDLPDDPAFPQWLAQTLQASGVTIKFVDLWDISTYAFSTPGSDKPLEEAAWAEYFGSGLASLTGTVVVSAAGANAIASAGVTVGLISAGATLATTVTAADGSFQFGGLLYGSYQVSFTPPGGAVLELGSLAAPVSGLTGTIALAAGGTIALGTEALLTSPASIAGTVIDSTRAGAGESGMTIDLISAAGGTIASTVTDTNGAFLFSDLAAATYEIDYILPATSLALSLNGIANPFTGQTGAIIAVAGQTSTLAAEALIAAPATIGGQVVATSSAAAGTPIAGISVALLNAAQQTVATLLTDANGNYQFTGLAAGSYTVKFVPGSTRILEAGGPANTSSGLTAVQTVTAGQSDILPTQTLLPAGGVITGQMLLSASGSGGTAIANAKVALTAAGVTIATTLTNAAGTFLFSGLAAGSYAVLYTAAAGQVLQLGGEANAATGLTPVIGVSGNQVVSLPAEQLLTNPASLSASVQFAGTGNWVLPGVTISLFTASGGLAATAITNSAGAVTFTGLAAGSYQLGFTPPTGALIHSGPAGLNTATGLTGLITIGAGSTTTEGAAYFAAASPATIAGHTFATNTAGLSAAQAGDSVTLLSASGAVLATDITSSWGAFSFYDLLQGSYQLLYTTPSGEVLGTGGPASTSTGITAPIAIAAGQVINLANETFLPAPATLAGSVTYAGTPLAGETVALINATGTLVATTSTGTLGSFQFTGLAAGSYAVQYSETATQLYGPGPASTATGLTPGETLTPGQTLTLATEALLPAPATLAGSVTYAGTPLAGEAVALINAAGATLATTTTGTTGSFQFTGLAPGGYEVQYGATSTRVYGAGPASPTTGLTPLETLSAGQTLTLATEALLPAPATLAGSTTYAGTPLAGEMVALINAAGATLATTTTGSIGSFQFSNLTAGTYEVEYGTTVTQIYGSGPASPTTGLTAMETLTPGQTLTLATEALLPAAGAIGGSVQTSASGSGPVAAPGVAVSLLAGGTSVASTLTDSNGNFQFSSLIAGTYTVQYAAPAGAVLELGSIANAITGQTPPLTLAAGQTLALAAQQMLTKPASLTASEVFAGTGTWPMVGATIALFNASGGLVGSAMTGSTGTVSFTGLAAGSYQLGYTLPAGTIIQSGPTILNTATGLTSLFTVAAGSATTETVTKLAAAAPARISGHVYYTNAAGVSAAQAGDSVTLLSAAGTPLATITTSSWGGFSFYNLLQGSYQLLFTPPPGETLAGGPGGTSGLTGPITVAAGQSINLANQTLVPAPSAIAGSVTYAGTALAGETVSLINATGTLVATTTTTSAGSFLFANLTAAAYEVEYATTATQIYGAGPASPITGLTPMQTLTPGQTLSLATEALLPAATATLSGVVQTSAGGTNSVILAGATVALVNAAGATLASAVSDGNGLFQFGSLAAGAYQLAYTAPAGQALELGSLADPTSGLTQALTLTQGQTLSVGSEQMLSRPNTINGFVEHYGAGDPGTGQSGVAISLLNAGGTAIASTLTNGAGNFSFAGLPTGTYQIYYATPAGEAIRSGYESDPTTGLSPQIVLGQATNTNLNKEVLQSTSNSFTLTGTAATAIRGNGSYVVTGNAAASALTLGAGNQTVSLTGGADTIIVGAGNSTISALGAANTFNAGAGMDFLTADGSAGNVFYLNGAGQGTTTIAGFNTSADMLDLSRTVSGLTIAPDLSNLATYVTAAIAGGSTTLSIDPTGGNAAPAAFAVLSGVSTSVAQLIAANEISLL